MSGRRRSGATLNDVAARVGVSPSTASRVLNGGVRPATGIPDATREAIWNAARELDYAVNSQAQSMAAGANRTIAVLATEIDDPGAAELVSGATRKARALGYSVFIALAGLTEHDEIDALRAVRGQRPTAVLVAIARSTDMNREEAFGAELEAFARAGGRISIIGDNTFGYNAVTLRNAESAAALAEDLVSIGYRRFAMIGGPADLITPRERAAGFARGLARHGIEIPADLVMTEDFDHDGGYRAAERLIGRIGDIDVVFAVSDAMALGAIARFAEEGISLPRDVTVAGFDDVPIVRDLDPPLSTVRVLLAEMAEQAVVQVLSPSDRVQTFEVSGTVMLRAGTPPLGD